MSLIALRLKLLHRILSAWILESATLRNQRVPLQLPPMAPEYTWTTQNSVPQLVAGPILKKTCMKTTCIYSYTYKIKNIWDDLNGPKSFWPSEMMVQTCRKKSAAFWLHNPFIACLSDTCSTVEVSNWKQVTTNDSIPPAEAISTGSSWIEAKRPRTPAATAFWSSVPFWTCSMSSLISRWPTSLIVGSQGFTHGSSIVSDMFDYVRCNQMKDEILKLKHPFVDLHKAQHIPTFPLVAALSQSIMCTRSSSPTFVCFRIPPKRPLLSASSFASSQVANLNSSALKARKVPVFARRGLQNHSFFSYSQWTIDLLNGLSDWVFLRKTHHFG